MCAAFAACLLHCVARGLCFDTRMYKAIRAVRFLNNRTPPRTHTRTQQLYRQGHSPHHPAFSARLERHNCWPPPFVLS
jgi:hypothetical protein